MQDNKELINKTIANQFYIIDKLGRGSFGDCYIAQNLINNTLVALKIDLYYTHNSQIPHEAKLLKILQGQEGFTVLHWFGNDEVGKNILAMDIQGPNLETLFQKCQRRFSLKTVLMMIDQMMKRIETIHNKNYIYRDIKPENFLIGKKAKQQQIIYLIDFGLCKRYKDQKTGVHIPYRDNKGLIGTARYVSINTHLGIEQSRKDDLESLAYVWIYFLKGKLPWQGIFGETKEEKYEKLKQKKLQTSIDDLCEGLPKEFKTYLKYCKDLKFEEQPNYYYLRQMFKELFFELDYQWDYMYDWVNLNENSDKTIKNQQNQSQNEDDDLNYFVKGSTTYNSNEQKVENKNQVSPNSKESNITQKLRQIQKNNVQMQQQQQQQQQQQPQQQQSQIQQQQQQIQFSLPVLNNQNQKNTEDKIEFSLGKNIQKKFNIDIYKEQQNLFDSIFQKNNDK